MEISSPGRPGRRANAVAVAAAGAFCSLFPLTLSYAQNTGKAVTGEASPPHGKATAQGGDRPRDAQGNATLVTCHAGGAITFLLPSGRSLIQET